MFEADCKQCGKFIGNLDFGKTPLCPECHDEWMWREFVSRPYPDDDETEERAS